jgi:Ca-activated chloride channel family protein
MGVIFGQLAQSFRAVKALQVWRKLLCLLLVYWAVMLSLSAHAQDSPTPLAAENSDTIALPKRHLSNREHGGFEIKRMEPKDAFEALPEDAILLSSHIDVEITGLIARATLKQRFKNTTSDWVAGTYRFPLPAGSAVDALTMIVGERKIIGKIKEKEEAKRIYERALKQGRKAALLNQARPNMFSSKVGNIAPGSEVLVEVSFISLSKQNGLDFSWHMPQAITPRFGADGQMEDAGGRPLPAGERFYSSRTDKNQTSFAVRLNAGTAVTGLASPSHDIRVVDMGKGRFEIALRDEQLPADRDFALRWSLTAAEAAKPVVFKEHFAGDTYLLGFLLPPNGSAHTAVVPPRDVTFVLDISGSMAGMSIRQAKAALLRALDLLRPEDRFDIILFNDDFRRLFGETKKANAKNLRLARSLVRRTQANGGTVMKGALASALSEGFDPEELRQIMFLTDGAVGYEEDMFRLVHENLGAARLFTVGLGSAPNGWFMRKAAEFGRGLYVKVDDIGEAQDRLENLFSAMAAPSISGLELAANGAAESYPERLPDLFGSRPAVFVSKLGGAVEKVELSGLTSGGEIWSASVNLKDVPRGNSIGKLWARKKVEGLMDAKVRGLPAVEVKAAVLATALKHGIMSPYTSFVAVEDKVSRQQAEALRKARIKGNLPKGTAAKQFFGPKTASPMLLQLLLGTLLLMLAMVSWLAGRRRVNA